MVLQERMLQPAEKTSDGRGWSASKKDSKMDIRQVTVEELEAKPALLREVCNFCFAEGDAGCVVCATEAEPPAEGGSCQPPRCVDLKDGRLLTYMTTQDVMEHALFGGRPHFHFFVGQIRSTQAD